VNSIALNPHFSQTVPGGWRRSDGFAKRQISRVDLAAIEGKRAIFAFGEKAALDLATFDLPRKVSERAEGREMAVATH
jgi:hypothetical protein